jgi:hypothetical protein
LPDSAFEVSGIIILPDYAARLVGKPFFVNHMGILDFPGWAGRGHKMDLLWGLKESNPTI